MPTRVDGWQSTLQKTVHRLLGYRKLNADTFVLILSPVVGLAAGFGAIGFRKLIVLFQYLALGCTGDQITVVLQGVPWYVKLLIPAVGGAVVGPMVYFFAREAKGHGVPEVMEAVALRGGIIRPRVVLVKSLASAITIGTGGSVGREGPIVQIGSALGSTVGQILGLTGQRLRVLLACGASAGIAATFNAPVAGVFFGVEIILGNYAIHTLSPLIISSVLATVVSRAYFGDSPAFVIPTHAMISAAEIPFYVLLGVLAGIVAVMFTKTLYAMEDLFDKVKLPEFTKAVVGGLIIGLGLSLFPQIYGVGYETITKLLRGEEMLGMALLLVLVKVLATSITIGSGGSGGIFAPSLLIGASLGGAFGMIVHGALPGVTAASGAYAVAGMGAVVAAATRGPITAIAIIFEMTGDYKIILPIMTACIIASLVAARLSRHSIYTLKLARRGVHLDEGLEPSLMRAAKVRDVMDQQASTLPSKTPLAEVLDLTSRSRLVNHYVVEPDGRVKGVMSIHEVRKVINQPSLGAALIAEDLADESVPTITPDSTLAEAIDLLFSRDVEELPVVDEEGKFLGVVSKHGILDLYQREALQEAGKGLKVIHRDDQTMRLDYIEVGEGHGIYSLPASAPMAGKTLEQLRLRSNYRVNVVAIRSARTGASTPPTDPRRVIEEGDVLVVMGTEADIQQMKKSLHIEG